MSKVTNTRQGNRPLNIVPPARTRQPEDLTAREKQILRLIWFGLTNQKIGYELGISIKTVDTHRANMMKKMRVSNTAQLVRTAIQKGLLKVG